jgi:TonB family protein
MKEKVEKKNNRIRIVIWSVSALVVLFFISAGLGAVKLLLSADDHKRKRPVHMVTLVKPPPPPKIKEKPPEPEIKKEEIIEPQEQEPEPDPLDDMADQDPPLDDDLGLDAEGTAGSDGFGLRAKKGGRSILGGPHSDAFLMRRFAWYTRIMQDELRKKVNQHMEQNGGIPDGNLFATISIILDDAGKITSIEISRSSGSKIMDTAVKQSLMLTRISEPPPPGMPKAIMLKISAKG